MRRQLRLLWGLSVALALGFGARAETLRIATGELPPYASAARPDQGLSLHIVRQAFAKVGVQVEYVFLPWTRAHVEALDGKWDATAAWGRNAERDKGFLISDNVLTEQWQILYRSDRNFAWSSLQDLKGLRIGTVADYTYTPEFWRMVKDGSLQADVKSASSACPASAGSYDFGSSCDAAALRSAASASRSSNTKQRPS